MDNNEVKVIEAKDLRLVKNKQEIFCIESFSLKKGEVLSLIGPNGTGKTSLLLTLALLQSPSQGTLYFNDRKITKDKIISLRRQMAVAFQEPLLFDTTVEQNILAGLKIRGIAKKEAMERADWWMSRLAIKNLAARPARHLSGGEAQRVNLARALVLEPKVLFLDEPFAALDYPTKNTLLKDLGLLLRETRQTTLFVSHDYTEIPFLTEKVAVMYQGKIIKNASIKEIFGPEILAQNKSLKVPWP
jgi:tungstate transport system ATP-binding protein